MLYVLNRKCQSAKVSRQFFSSKLFKLSVFFDLCKKMCENLAFLPKSGRTEAYVTLKEGAEMGLVLESSLSTLAADSA